MLTSRLRLLNPATNYRDLLFIPFPSLFLFLAEILTMGRSILFLCVLCVLAVIPSAHLHLPCVQASNEGQPQKCSHILIRKEWRTLTYSEKAEWVGAVKVRALLPIP